MIPDAMTVSLILFGGLAVLIVLRVPIGFALGISGVVTFLYTKGSFMAMAQTYYDAVDSFPLMAIPLFFWPDRSWRWAGFHDGWSMWPKR